MSGNRRRHDRDEKIIEMMGAGHTNREIAAAIGVHERDARKLTERLIGEGRLKPPERMPALYALWRTVQGLPMVSAWDQVARLPGAFGDRADVIPLPLNTQYELMRAARRGRRERPRKATAPESAARRAQRWKKRVDEGTALRRAGLIPQRNQMVAELVEARGKTHAEAAKIVGISRSNVSQILKKMRAKKEALALASAYPHTIKQTVMP